MSKLIDALNRLQDAQQHARVAGMASSPKTSEGEGSVSSRRSSPSVTRHHGKAQGGHWNMEFSLSVDDWEAVLTTEYLHSFAREGGAAVKFGVCVNDEVLRDCQKRLEKLARQEAFVHARIDSRFTKVHMVEKVFHKIAKQLDWEDLAYRFLVRLLEENGYHVPSHRHEFSLRQIAALNERKEPMLRRDVQSWLEKAIEEDTGLCREFRMAMIRLCLAQLDAGDTDRVLGAAVKDWLCGDLRLLSGVKKALIYQKIARHNARYMLSSLTRWLRLCGKGGLVLTVDISQYFLKGARNAQDGALAFSPSATMDLYELLRQFVDSTDEMEGLLMVVLAPHDFLSDSRRNVDRYAALKLRLWDDIRPKYRQNPLSSLVRLSHSAPSRQKRDSSQGSGRRNVPLPDLEARRVIEGLRGGVPNRHVVNAVGCLQPEVEGRFRRLLEATRNNVTSGICPRGMVIEGEFGSGKSHVLEYLQNLALEENFICSRVVISKETPFYHPVRLFYSAIESAVIPNKRGEIFSEIAGACDVWTPRYKDLVSWVNNPENGIDSRFAATLLLYERMSSDMELGHRMARFWAGDPIGVGDVKRYLQEAGFGGRYSFGKISASQLATQRFQFAARLMQAAGYAGWILLVDEVELIGRYSVQQRAKSYAEIARLMHMDGGPHLPGLGTVLALTDDYRQEVLEKKGDATKLVDRFLAKGTDMDKLLAQRAQEGMQLLQTQRIPLGSPSPDMVRDVHRTIRSLHLKGHGWHMWEEATDAPPVILQGISMRKYVKSWVTQWDFLRLFPGEECELESSTWKFPYEEEADVSQSAIHAEACEDVTTVMPSSPKDSVSQEAELVTQVFSADPEPPSGSS